VNSASPANGYFDDPSVVSVLISGALAGAVNARPFTVGQNPPGTGNCSQPGPHPYHQGPCLNASDLSNASEKSADYPPSNAHIYSVPTNAELKALSATAGATVRRSGFYTPGDGGAADYTLWSSPCSLNSGRGDNGVQVQALAAGCWNIEPGSNSLSPLVWGAKGDGTTDDTAAVRAAIDGASRGDSNYRSQVTN
jgi:hypothetical protein